jgi:hypothetical protein
MHLAVVVRRCWTQSDDASPPFEALFPVSQERIHIELIFTTNEPSRSFRRWPGFQDKAPANPGSHDRDVPQRQRTKSACATR